jgi:hypothetical protein
MSFIQNEIWTADPGNIWASKSSFMSSDPFAIVMGVQVDQSVVAEGLLFDAVYQLVNPRQDPYNHAWYTVSDSNLMSMPTVDNDWTAGSFNWGTNFAIWFWWSHYADAVSQLYGPDRLDGVFYAQGTISVEGSNLFSAAAPFWYKVRS